MIVSNEPKFLFVQIPKSGGTSVARALAAYDTEPPPGMRKSKHKTLAELVSHSPSAYADHFRFAFVRNPWDRMVSFFFYLQQKRVQRIPEIQQVASFADFLTHLDRDADWLMHRHSVRAQSEFVEGADARGIDFVGRYESLARDFETVCRQLGVTAQLGRHNVSSHNPYQEYYNDWGRDLISRRYARDIEKFGFVFGQHD